MLMQSGIIFANLYSLFNASYTAQTLAMKTSRSKELFEKAKQYFPGGVNSPVRAFRSVGGTPHFIAKVKVRIYGMLMEMNSLIIVALGAHLYLATPTNEL